MQILRREILRDFKGRHPEVSIWVNNWEAEVQRISWPTPMAVKARHSSASFLKNNVVILNVKGNNFRLAVRVHYQLGIVEILKAGTHQEYLKWKFE